MVSSVAAAGGGAAAALLLYLWHVERGQRYVPEEARKLAPTPWTEQEIRECYERISKKPIDFTPLLPPKLERRYIIVGGSGLVGGYMILHLLQRGQAAESIRNVDFRGPVREDLKTGEAAKIDFRQADITSEESLRAAFEAPWPKSVAELPLTVLHTAAIIIPEDRFKALLSKVTTVNIVGTANVIAASKKAGADVFIATSSGSIAIRPPEIWIPPWRSRPRNMMQVYPDPDKDNNIRGHYEYFGNYAASKARAEQLTLKANTKTFKTGAIRPACGVYGNPGDLTVAAYLRQKSLPSWIPHVIQNFVHAENVSIAHLQYEAALLSHPSQTSGRAYTVTDPGRAHTFGDLYTLLSTLADFQWQTVPAVPLLLIAYVIEFYSYTRFLFPQLRSITPNVPKSIQQLQPGIFLISAAHQIAVNTQAMLPPAKGGIGYTPACTSMEGMCQQVKNWNDDLRRRGLPVKADRAANVSVVQEIKNVAVAPGSAATK